MSLRNAFRLSVVSVFIVMSSIDAPTVAFTLHRTTVNTDTNRDLAQEESTALEVKRDLNGQNNIQLNLNKTIRIIRNNETSTGKPVNSFGTEDGVPNNEQTTTLDVTTETIVPQETTIPDDERITLSTLFESNTDLHTITTNLITEADTLSPITDNLKNGLEIETTTESQYLDIFTTENNNTDSINVNVSTPIATSEKPKNNTDKMKQKILESKKYDDASIKDKIIERVTSTLHKSRPMPKWKKYTTIQRKRPSLSSDEKYIKRNKAEDAVKGESKQSRVTLQDTVTSDIPSLEQLKTDLLSSTIILQMSESKSGVTLKPLIIEQSTISVPTILTTENNLKNTTVESKRAGFLNFSGKTTNTDVTTERMTSDFKIDNNEPLRSIFETQGPEIDTVRDKPVHKFASQSILNEDAIKEELLKEELINDNQENAKRLKEDLVHAKADIADINNISVENSTSLDDNLSVKPIINPEKSKNSSLYSVNPNYKPMKKIEVLPPKQFVRDPDDNSWRNESLSSLGIVFKPKNSSKPFTQVLKNKTETEWNNLSEKDSKNDIPDLRERLQKMAEMRKSKRKKIDSFGNIVYFDYEENSNSAESGNELFSPVTTSSPDLRTTEQSNSSSPSETKDNATVTLTTESVKNSYTTKKFKKFFNVPEYYDSTDEDDSDYLNMAKLDLKKFSTSLRTPSSPFHPTTIVAKQPEWLTGNKKLTHNAFPERKATVQYFPPLTTQKVNVNDYDNDFKLKVESFTTEKDVPKRVLPASTTPASVNTVQYNKDITSNLDVTNKPDFTQDLRVTPPPLTTDPTLALENSDGIYDRGTYIIKHFKDFINEAAKDSEVDKSMDFIPYTETNVEGTKPDLLGYEQNKDRMNVENAYDYDAQFRKDVLQRFVDSFNQNSERYKTGFPILFNNSVIHRGPEGGGDIASSRAFMRGLYSSDIFKPRIGYRHRSCEPNCENVTVELSPSYELHYYVPDQEEKEEVVPQPVTLPYQYGL